MAETKHTKNGMNQKEFRKELKKIMPGYKWTIHRPFIYSDIPHKYLRATGTQSSGFNRLSTLEVIKRQKDDDCFEYEVRSTGFGLRACWLSEYTDGTLARALRGLQDHYERMATEYSSHAMALQRGRKGTVAMRKTENTLHKGACP